MYGYANGNGGPIDYFFKYGSKSLKFVNDQPATIQLVLMFAGPIAAEYKALQSVVTVNAGAKAGMTELQLVTKAAQKAEAAIGGSGGVAGTLKHTYAKNLLSRHQSMFGGELSLGSNYFNNNTLLGVGNRGFLDVVNHSTKTIYDFKFGSAVISNAQYLKYSRNF